MQGIQFFLSNLIQNPNLHKHTIWYQLKSRLKQSFISKSHIKINQTQDQESELRFIVIEEVMGSFPLM